MDRGDVIDLLRAYTSAAAAYEALSLYASDSPPHGALLRVLELQSGALDTLNAILKRELADVPPEEWPDLLEDEEE